MTRRAALGRGIALAGAVGAGEVGATAPARAFIDLPSRLHNRYFFVRHGESVLDVRNGGMILSNPSFKYDTTFGLTARGRAQMQEAAKTILRDYDGAPAWLYTSNFQRSFQSALVLREEIGLLFSQMRTEFSGLLDPEKDGCVGFRLARGVGRRLEERFRRPLLDAPLRCRVRCSRRRAWSRA